VRCPRLKAPRWWSLAIVSRYLWLSGILRGEKLLYYQLLMSTDGRFNILRSESSGAPDF
jgi:hypothetical protein